jgi:glycosyltransferase involved in cell wall biosynthesis
MMFAHRPKVVVITHAPSPYQVELFDRVASLDRLDLFVIYLIAKGRDRLWAERQRAHEAKVLSHEDYAPESATFAKLRTANLLVANYYQHEFVREALRETRSTRARVVFWGERPHQHSFSSLAAVYRRYRLSDVVRTRGMIWGKGRLAVEAYRREFGQTVHYENLPYFSDLERFAFPTRRAPEDSFRRFLFSGALIHRKGVDTLAEAFSRLVAQGSDAKLMILGAGEMEASLRAQLSSVGERCQFLGFADWDLLSAHYRRADILCAPSRYDGWGLIVPEGLAAGLPVISTKTTGSAVEFIRNGQNGWLIPPDDVEALYGVMNEACNLSADKLVEMSENAVASVTEHSLQRGAERFVAAAFRALERESI